MEILFFSVASLILGVTIVSAELREVSLYDRDWSGGSSVKLTYSDECVNLDKAWQKAVSSVRTHGSTCVTLYTEPDCSGKYVQVHTTWYGDGGPLRELDFDKKAVSFEKCDSELRKHDYHQRPSYTIYVYPQRHQEAGRFGLGYQTGCNNLPNAWLGRVSSLDTWDQCVILYTENDCKGRGYYVVYVVAPGNDLGDIGIDKKLKSYRSCDLYYKPSCSWCPKTAFKRTNEYEFWLYLFSIYSSKYHTAFMEQVKKHPNGTISWDFLFAPKTAAKNFGDQYQDALNSHRGLFQRLRHSRIGYMNFKPSNINALRVLAKRVLEEKEEVSSNPNFSENWDHHEFAVYKELLLSWEKIVDVLDSIYNKYWQYPEDKDCGKRKNVDGTDTLISNGDIAEYGDDPWHVAIYKNVRKKENVLICGGTLVSRSLVISAAHCFYNKALGSAENNTSEYEVYVAKYTRDYSHKDGDYQKIHKIKSLVFHPRGYNSKATSQHGSDIILIILDTPVIKNKHVLPICLDWGAAVYGFNPSPGTRGRIVGWGENDEGVTNEVLLSATIPYISFNDCVGKVVHVTNDKFCGGSSEGPGARRGDSGGGFIFEKGGRYYLRGIISTKDHDSSSSISTFTDVSLYLDWIRDYLGA